MRERGREEREGREGEREGGEERRDVSSCLATMAASLLRCVVVEGWVQGGHKGAGEMGVRGSCPLAHPCCAGLIAVHLYRVQELGACADGQPRGDPRCGRWHGRRRPRQQPGLHVSVRLRQEQVEGRLVLWHCLCSGAAWAKCPLGSAPNAAPAPPQGAPGCTGLFSTPIGGEAGPLGVRTLLRVLER